MNALTPLPLTKDDMIESFMGVDFAAPEARVMTNDDARKMFSQIGLTPTMRREPVLRPIKFEDIPWPTIEFTYKLVVDMGAPRFVVDDHVSSEPVPKHVTANDLLKAADIMERRGHIQRTYVENDTDGRGRLCTYAALALAVSDGRMNDDVRQIHVLTVPEQDRANTAIKALVPESIRDTFQEARACSWNNMPGQSGSAIVRSMRAAAARLA